MPSDHTTDFYTRLKHRLEHPLPGIDAQRRLAIVDRKLFSNYPAHAQQSAVSIVFYPHEDKLRIAYIQRTKRDDDHHSGQISFPGGKMEASDDDIRTTAFRELAEETGIVAPSNSLIGRITSLYIPVSNFIVHPFLLGLDTKPDVLRQDTEVDEIFGYDIDDLLKMPIRHKSIHARGFVIKNAPFFDLNGRTLWGATAMMTNEVLEVIRSM